MAGYLQNYKSVETAKYHTIRVTFPLAKAFAQVLQLS